MIKLWRLKLIFVLLMAVSSTGCVLAVAEKLLGDKVATHDDDQSVESGDNEGYINN